LPKKTPKKYEFDAVFSFAGEDRSHAEAIVRATQKRNLRVFYDKDFRAHLWGKKQDEFERIYGPAGRYFIPLLSENYLKKDWTQLELSLAKRERRKRKGDHFLPIKIDDTTILGISDDLIYLSVDQCTPDEIAEAITDKVRAIESQEKPKKAQRRSSTELALLQEVTRRALSLVASSSLPVTSEALQELFPDIAWNEQLRKLTRLRFIATEHQRIVAAPEVVKAIKDDKQQWSELNEQWISVLEPLRQHVDLCLSLSLHYLSAQRIDDAIAILAETVESGDLGFWNDIYGNALTVFFESRTASKADPKLKLQACNGIALCFLRRYEYAAAKPWIEKLRDRSRRAKDDYWLGQSYLHLGISCAGLSLLEEASRWYRKAEKLGINTKDDLLVGRALGNLSQLLSTQNIREAREVLNESLTYKRKAKDRGGLAVAEGQLANLLYLSGDNKGAIDRYKKAIKKLGALGLRDDWTLALIHLGVVRSESSQKAGACSEFQKAVKLADKYGFPDLQKLALSLDAQICHELGDMPGVQSACASLLQLARDTDDVENKVCALHGQGIADILAGEKSNGRRKLTRALKEASQIDNRHWIERCGVDLSREIEDGTLGEPVAKTLKRRAQAWENQRKLVYAGDLWANLGDRLSIHDADPSAALLPYRSAVDCFSKARETKDAVFALVRIADCHERLREYEDSLERLTEAESLAKGHRDLELSARVMNQRAILLKELNRFGASAAVLRKAITIQRKLPNKSELQTTIHNLGEVLRNAERYQEALDSLNEAETLARSLGDIESAICSAHSKGLVLEHMGDEKAASQLFQSCRNEAKREAIWHEYVRAWEAMANLAWCQRKRQTAISRYRRALADAKKYKCDGPVLRIVGNLANALYWVGQFKRARKLLVPHEDVFSESISSYLYYAKLADVYEACDEPDKALEEWRKGEESAIAADNAEYMAYCAAGLGTNQQARENHSEAEKALKKALEHEQNPEDRVTLLSQLLDTLLEQRNDELAGHVFNEATELARAECLHENVIDLHMRIFDYHWSDGREEKLEALKAWSVAVLESFMYEDGEVMGSLLGHVVGTLTTEGSAPNAALLEKIRHDLEEWLIDLLPSNQWVTDFIVGQLDIIKELLPYVGKPRQLARRAQVVFSELDKRLAE